MSWTKTDGSGGAGIVYGEGKWVGVEKTGMTPDEAAIVARAAATADGGCPVCLGVIAGHLLAGIPAFDWPALIAQAAQDHYMSAEELERDLRDTAAEDWAKPHS